MFIRPRHVGAYDYSEACESYRKDGKPTQRVIARWPAEQSLADALDLCEFEIITCLLWLHSHKAITMGLTQPWGFNLPGIVRRGIREHRYGAAGYRRRLVRAQRRLTGLRKVARATGITVRTGKLPARVMLGTETLEHWQAEDLKEAKAAILAEMQRRQQREAARASLQRRLRAATSGRRPLPSPSQEAP